ncbi:MAG: BMC domain-containing protein [Firmicutes bacterium]|jgi:microcompartment protein CcmL/EutN|nr:BMC domain-containing protein [Bacillota bacterium]
MGVERVPSALGFLEVKGAADGVAAVDTAVKAALVEVLQTKVVCSGKFTVLLAGQTAAVEAAVAAAKKEVGASLYDSCVIGRVHHSLYWAIQDQFPEGSGQRDKAFPRVGNSVGIVEALSIAVGLEAADAALKAAEVNLFELRLGYALGGRSYFAFTGTTGAVKAALDTAVQVASQRGGLGSSCLIPQFNAAEFLFMMA